MMKFLLLILITWSFFLQAQEENLYLEEEDGNRIEVLEKFPRFRIQYNFEKVAREIEIEIQKKQEDSSQGKTSK